MNKIYFQHTSKFLTTKAKFSLPSTIALKKVGNVFLYGVSICGEGDNFSKKIGRELAEKRLLESFGRIEVPKRWETMSEEKQCLRMLRNISISLIDSRKYKERLFVHNIFVHNNPQQKVISQDSN